MQTPWGNIDIEDAHAHLFSYSFFQALAQQKGTPDIVGMIDSLGWTIPPQNNPELARQWVAELNDHDISKTVLMASIPGDEDSSAEAVRTYPERFYGYFMLNPLAGDALQRARRAFEELGLQGVCLFPAMHKFSVQDERLAPLYKLVAEASDRVVFVHMGTLTVGVRNKLGLPSRFDMSFSNPMDLQLIASEYPDVKFVIPHFGAGYFREALMLASIAPNVYLDTSSSNNWTRYMLPQPTLSEVFARALDVVGPNRLLFGSDSSFFPRGWNQEVFTAQCKALHQLQIPQQDAIAIFGGNLAQLMKRS